MYIMEAVIIRLLTREFQLEEPYLFKKYRGMFSNNKILIKYKNAL